VSTLVVAVAVALALAGLAASAAVAASAASAAGGLFFTVHLTAIDSSWSSQAGRFIVGLHVVIGTRDFWLFAKVLSFEDELHARLGKRAVFGTLQTAAQRLQAHLFRLL